MVLYAGRSIANMYVENWGEWNGPFPSGGTVSSVAFNLDIPTQIEVNELSIRFKVDYEFHDHPISDNGKGRFKAWLDVMRDGGWQNVDYKEDDLGNDHDNGDWYDSYEISHTMEFPMEMYRVRLECRTKDTSLGTSAESSKTFTCVQAIGYIGDFTLDYVPLSIVYCPPGQDMTNNLSHTIQYASMTTIGNSYTMQSVEGVHLGASYKGIASIGMGYQESQSTSNTAVNGIEISDFRNTVITADNRQAIGRAYWGPLSDLFLVMVNPKFAASQRADGIIFYEHQDTENLLIIPAHKLLRPGDDPIVSNIPADDRRKILELDPFIYNLDLFFPVDTGADLHAAANPYADPSRNNRAEPIGLWYLSQGTVLNYSIGDGLKLINKIGTEETFSTTMSGSAAIIIGPSASFTTSVGIQWSKEVTNYLSKSATCFLIKNQNDPDTYAIKLYYDRNFGTIMFRKVMTGALPIYPHPFPWGWDIEWMEIPYGLIERIKDLIGIEWPFIPEIPEGPKPPIPWPKQIGLDLGSPDLNLKELFPDLSPDEINALVKEITSLIIPNKSLIGKAKDLDGNPIFHENVILLSGKEKDQKVIALSETDGNGNFRIDNLFSGIYTINIGNKSKDVKIDIKHEYNSPYIQNISDVRRIIDLNNCPIWKFRRIANLNSDRINRYRDFIRRNFNVFNEEDLIFTIQKDQKEFQSILKNNIFVFPKKPLNKLDSITKKQIEVLGNTGIKSIQKLWTEIQINNNLSNIHKKTGIEQEILTEWAEKENKNRVSIKKPTWSPEEHLKMRFSSDSIIKKEGYIARKPQKEKN